jgi:hypothetical protein
MSPELKRVQLLRRTISFESSQCCFRLQQNTCNLVIRIERSENQINDINKEIKKVLLRKIKLPPLNPALSFRLFLSLRHVDNRTRFTLFHEWG